MRLTILGGGGFRVPLVYRALLDDRGKGRVTHVTLYDIDASRIAAIGPVLAEQADGVADAPETSITTDLDEAITGADFIFSAVKAVEQAAIEAATTGSRAAALRAFATHPLVDSVTIAGRLLEQYERELPQLAYLHGRN